MNRTICVAFGLMLAGCGRLVSIDYEPTKKVKGEGVLRVSPFKYEAADMHRVRPHQVETHPAAKTELLLVEEVGAFFSNAVKKELLKSG